MNIGKIPDKMLPLVLFTEVSTAQSVSTLGAVIKWKSKLEGRKIRVSEELH